MSDKKKTEETSSRILRAPRFKPEVDETRTWRTDIWSVLSYVEDDTTVDDIDREYYLDTIGG